MVCYSLCECSTFFLMSRLCYLSVFHVIFFFANMMPFDPIRHSLTLSDIHYTQNQNNQTRKQLYNEAKDKQIIENLRLEGTRPPVKYMCIPPRRGNEPRPRDRRRYSPLYYRGEDLRVLLEKLNRINCLLLVGDLWLHGIFIHQI